MTDLIKKVENIDFLTQQIICADGDMHSFKDCDLLKLHCYNEDGSCIEIKFPHDPEDAKISGVKL